MPMRTARLFAILIPVLILFLPVMGIQRVDPMTQLVGMFKIIELLTYPGWCAVYVPIPYQIMDKAVRQDRATGQGHC